MGIKNAAWAPLTPSNLMQGYAEPKRVTKNAWSLSGGWWSKFSSGAEGSSLCKLPTHFHANHLQSFVVSHTALQQSGGLTWGGGDAERWRYANLFLSRWKSWLASSIIFQRNIVHQPKLEKNGGSGFFIYFGPRSMPRSPLDRPWKIEH